MLLTVVALVIVGCAATTPDQLAEQAAGAPTTSFLPIPPPSIVDMAATNAPGALSPAVPEERAIPEAPAQFDGAPPPAAPPPAPLAASAAPAAPSGGVWAVIIGIDDYPGRSSDLRYARNDAAAVDAALSRFGVPGDRRLRLTDGQATASVIGRAADWLVSRAGPDATAIFVFAGHIRKIGSNTQAMVGADGGLVTDAELAGRLDRLQASRTWIMMAGCYGGGFNEVLRPGRILTGASPADQLAYENTELQHSYLVEFMVVRAMLEGSADRSVEVAFAWAVDALRREHPNRLPVQYDQVDGEFRLGVPGPAVRSAPPPSSTTTTPGRSGTTTTTQPPRRETDDDQGCVLTMGSMISCPDD